MGRSPRPGRGEPVRLVRRVCERARWLPHFFIRLRMGFYLFIIPHAGPVRKTRQIKYLLSPPYFCKDT